MKLNQIHTAHNSSREIPKYIFTIFLIKFFFLFKHFFFYFLLKFPITPLLLLNVHFHFTITLQKKKKDPIFKANFIYIS